MKLLLLSISMLLFLSIYSQDLEVNLWENNIPNNRNVLVNEQSKERPFGDVHIWNVTNPMISVYKTKKVQNSPAVIICPGGGYGILSYNKEGHHVAKYLAENGIVGIVLKYRLPKDTLQKDKHEVPLMDVQRSFQIVRENAKKWGVDVDKIGIMGFSAGGHLATSASKLWRTPFLKDVTPEEVRPAFSILIYPVASFQDEITHKGSRKNLLGKSPTQDMIDKYSGEVGVDKETPKAFLVHSFDDKSVPIENSINYMQALKKNGVSCESHFYDIGGHGYGMLREPGKTWPQLMINWLNRNFK